MQSGFLRRKAFSLNGGIQFQFCYITVGILRQWRLPGGHHYNDCFMVNDQIHQSSAQPVIVAATIDDAAELLAVQRAAFHQEAVFYNNFTITPLVETLEEYIGTFNRYTVLKAVADGKIVGSVRAHAENGTCCITRLVVHPGWQRHGIGSRLMRGIEDCYRSSVNRFELFTGGESSGNIVFYAKCGYRVFNRCETTEVPMVFMEKYTRHRISVPEES